MQRSYRELLNSKYRFLQGSQEPTGGRVRGPPQGGGTLMLMKFMPLSRAAAPASRVFPVPGAPYSRSPERWRMGSLENRTGYWGVQRGTRGYWGIRRGAGPHLLVDDVVQVRDADVGLDQGDLVHLLGEGPLLHAVADPHVVVGGRPSLRDKHLLYGEGRRGGERRGGERRGRF